uniref:Lipid-binding serum glycoprotein C-terminal domain-containing protein n=1 Tax=Meloidogyne floridensis TaxID=298350 RepID=A0A915NXZ5_9BILA
MAINLYGKIDCNKGIATLDPFARRVLSVVLVAVLPLTRFHLSYRERLKPRLIHLTKPNTYIQYVTGTTKSDNLSNRGSVYESVQIDDPAEDGSSGIYFRISQKGVDYLANLASKGLPKIMNRLALPMISESGLVISDAVITKMDEPQIGVKFVPDYGVDLSVGIPEVSITGGTVTVQMRVFIHRNLSEESTSVEVTNCTVNPGTFVMKFYGPEASEFYAIVDIIRDGIDGAIRDKICTLPPLMREFIYQKIHEISSPQSFTNQTTHYSDHDNLDDPSTIFNQLCSTHSDGRRRSSLVQGTSENPQEMSQSKSASSEDEQALEVDIAEMNVPNLLPDLTLRYPPKFSHRDLIFGIDGGFMSNGNRAPAFVKRPKFSDIQVRDQMLGLIFSEFLPNTLFYHIFNSGLGHVSVSYSHYHMPRMLANLTKTPKALIDRNGVTLLLEGDIGAHFWRKNRTYNILSANGQLRVGIKPHFRHSRLYNDVLLAGVDFKIYRAGMEGLVSGAVRKLLRRVPLLMAWGLCFNNGFCL